MEVYCPVLVVGNSKRLGLGMIGISPSSARHCQHVLHRIRRGSERRATASSTCTRVPVTLSRKIPGSRKIQLPAIICRTMSEFQLSLERQNYRHQDQCTQVTNTVYTAWNRLHRQNQKMTSLLAVDVHVLFVRIILF